MTDTLEIRRDREVAWRKMHAAEATMTSPNMSFEFGFSPAINRYSTSPMRALEHVQYVILGKGKILRGPIVGNEWILEEIASKEKSPNDATIFDTAEDVQWFREALELGMTEIATLFRVTRRAVYDWSDGAKATDAPFIKAVRLLIEEHVRAENRPYLRQFWDSVIGGQESLFEILKSGDPQRLQGKALTALNALDEPISSYVSQLAAKPSPHVTAHTHNDDIYRSL